jgi:hypothetical protein
MHTTLKNIVAGGLLSVLWRQAWWYVPFGEGNGAQNIFAGELPPPPPVDPGPFVIDRSNCQQILGMFCPKA